MHPKARIAAAAFGLLSIIVSVPAPSASPAVSSTLSWTAPGDDGMSGRAQQYSLRYSTAPIVEANFNNATAVSGLPAPAISGATETFTVSGLVSNTVYYFAIKTRDEAGNWSLLSNVAIVPPGTVAVEELPASVSFAAPWPNPARAALNLAFSLPRSARVQVDAFSVDGRRVRRLESGSRPAGHGTIAWDLRDDAGIRVPAGVYLVRALLGDTVWSRRVTVIQ
jgi:hypothetical protein